MIGPGSDKNINTLPWVLLLILLCVWILLRLMIRKHTYQKPTKEQGKAGYIVCKFHDWFFLIYSCETLKTCDTVVKVPEQTLYLFKYIFM